MKIGLLAFLSFFIHLTIYSQTLIKGKITSSKGEVLEGASVYLNNTTIGTITNNKGEFQLKINEGNYDLVISFLGYKTKQTSINTNTLVHFLNFKMNPETNILDEVVLRKTKYDADWKYNLSRFKQAFLGRTQLAEQCEILNPKSIHFYYDSKANKLTAFAKEPLRIKHKGLGYLINYDLIDFELKNKQLFFSGYARYQNLRKSIRNKWKRNRLIAFNGSKMHFLRSLLSQKVKEEGFVVNQFKRVLNPERPSDEKIKLAKELVKLHGNKIDFFKEITEPKTNLDSALVVLKNSRKSKYRDYLYKTDASYNEIVSKKKEITYLDFKNYLMVIYTKETEEENYLKSMFGERKKASGMQTSNIVLLNEKDIINHSGVLTSPNAVFNEGYWGFESFANMLPLDYQP
jgi:hypothetical protein